MNHEKHICQTCKQETACNLPSYACPWLNEDEIQVCGKCEEQMIVEYEAKNGSGSFPSTE